MATDGGKLDRLLERTSRTFALSIPRLPPPTRRQVGIAYLLFRIADTFEDATAWSPRDRVDALDDFSTLLDGAPIETARRLAARWSAEPPAPGHDGYRELVAETPFVLDRFATLESDCRDAVRRHLNRTVDGMRTFVTRHGDAARLVLDSLDELRSYCYAVAGIVGEMLTEIFLLGATPAELAPELESRAAEFGEGLQLVNVLRDADSDRSHGRIYLPQSVDRGEVFALARRDLEVAAEYVRALQGRGAADGIVAFSALPVLLARATLRRVEEEGPGSKISRPEVFALVERMERDLTAGTPVV